jgi:hypothetical protein
LESGATKIGGRSGTPEKGDLNLKILFPSESGGGWKDGSKYD